jgi:hypothetical protein
MNQELWPMGPEEGVKVTKWTERRGFGLSSFFLVVLSIPVNPL